ncbi:hypothetical protein NR800_06335 [Corallococcus interemptor]|uniref:hypothetical protein n=1 Tax=Corallococcus TaxID=83461 RepID=UPI001CC069EE|nr:MULTISPECIES: hypothetical protein [unclassified Corallococcus]MBZ4333446.1 hypothetical protein [Corallococcus sp. AS-1-12]MBZ4371874.1 hypothetical protein [Corallococcus sp. AS-1-6]
MSLVKQQGILSPGTQYAKDADVIMTAAVLGWAWSRLTNADVNKRHARVDFEVEDAHKLTEQELREKPVDPTHLSAIQKLNNLLHASGLKPDQKVELGTTPIWTTGGRITGGSGDKSPNDAYRYNPPLPDGYAAKLFLMATNPATADKLGYQGRGAYTGFIDGRTDGQTGLMSTFRHNVPFDITYGRRWHPPEAPADRPWGMIGSEAMQDHEDRDPEKQGLKQQGMHFEGPTPQRGHDICAYTHGMIQAIYDVHFHKLANDTSPNKKTPYNPGTPYEIAVGKKTTKLASCFPCSVFMEATGHPASSTHLGRGESWSPLFPPPGSTTTQHKAWQACNTQWQDYCKTIIDAGLQCLKKAPAQVKDEWKASVGALDLYLNGPNGVNKTPATAAQAYANLLLDAVTVHDSEVRRIDRALK